MRSGVDPVGAGAEIDPVQVDFEDLVLCETVLEPERQQRLPDLAGEAALRSEEEHFGELLGDCAAALNDVPSTEIGHGGAHQADRVDPEMAVEAAVLGRDDRLRQIGRHLLQGQRLAEQSAEIGQRAAILGEDRDGRAALRRPELTGIGQGQREIAERAAAKDGRPQDEENDKPQQAARQAPPAARHAWAAALPWGAAPASPQRGAEPLGRIDSQRPIAHRPPRWLPPQRPAGRIAFPLLRGSPPPRPGIMPETMASVRSLWVRACSRSPARAGTAASRQCCFSVGASAERAMTDAIRSEAAANVGQGERLGSLVAGAVLIGRALSRPTWGRIAAGVGGAVLLARAITGHCGVYEKLGISGSLEKPTPRRRHRWRDPVLEASEE